MYIYMYMCMGMYTCTTFLLLALIGPPPHVPRAPPGRLINIRPPTPPNFHFCYGFLLA